MSMDAAPTITEFLLARIAEDEGAAEWVMMAFPDGDTEPLSRRVLAECAAKRAIAEVHESYFAKQQTCSTCRDLFDDDAEDYPCVTIRALAAIYADHPDYRQEWAL